MKHEEEREHPPQLGDLPVARGGHDAGEEPHVRRTRHGLGDADRPAEGLQQGWRAFVDAAAHASFASYGV